MIGLIIGAGSLERRREGVRLRMEQSNRNVEYLMWLHKFWAERGYCNPVKPKIKKRVGKGGIKYTYVKSTYSLGGLNWLYEMLYKDKVKIISNELEIYITPLSLAIWYMDEGSSGGAGIRIETKEMRIEEVEKLCRIIKRKFNIECSPKSDGKGNNFIKIGSGSELIKLVRPYMINSMNYKTIVSRKYLRR